MSVLIIKMGALGDLIMSTPAIRSIIRHHNNEPVWLLTSPAYAHLFQQWPGLQVKSLPRKGVVAMLKTLFWIRKLRFVRLYDLQSSERTAAISLLSGIAERAGNHPGIAYTRHPPERYTGQCHALDRLNQILASAGVVPCADPPFLPVSEESRARVALWVKENNLPDRSFVLMHAGASSKHAHKRWPHFLELAVVLKQRGLKTLWLGGPEDRALNTALAAKVGTDTTGLFSIGEEAELGRHARFAVTNDSAPMHILSCSGIPVFGLFGPTDWVRTHAINQQDYVISAPGEDRLTGYRHFKPQEMATITVDRVVTRLQQAGLLQ